MDRRSLGARTLVLADLKRERHQGRHALQAVLGCLRSGWLSIDGWRLVVTEAGERQLARSGVLANEEDRR